MGDNFYKKQKNQMVVAHLKYLNPKKDLVSEHIHSEYEILYILNGDVTYIVEDKKYKLKKYDLIITRPNQYHLIQIDSSACYERQNVIFDENVINIKGLNHLLGDLDVVNCKHIPIIANIFEKIDYYLSVLEEEKFFEMVAILIKELVYNLNIVKNLDKTQAEAVHPLIKQALEIINQNLSEEISINELAQRLFVSQSFLHRLFKSQLKITPHKYINEKRLYMARELLKQGVPSTKASESCGFFDYASFYRNYIKKFGYPPSKEK